MCSSDRLWKELMHTSTARRDKLSSHSSVENSSSISINNNRSIVMEHRTKDLVVHAFFGCL